MGSKSTCNKSKYPKSISAKLPILSIDAIETTLYHIYNCYTRLLYHIVAAGDEFFVLKKNDCDDTIQLHFYGSVQDCGNSIANIQDLPQPCAKSSISYFYSQYLLFAWLICNNLQSQQIMSMWQIMMDWQQL